MDTVGVISCAADVNKLSAKQVNDILRSHGKPASGSRRHKIVVVCELYGVKDDPESFQHLLTEVKKSKFGWTKDLRKCPAVTLTADCSD